VAEEHSHSNQTHSADLSAVATDNAAHVPDAFFDIELPVPPGVDWVLWFEWFAGAGLVVLLAFLFVWLATQFGPRLALQNVLKQLKQQLRLAGHLAPNELALPNVLSESKQSLYQAWQQAQKQQVFVQKELARVDLEAQESRAIRVKQLHQQIQHSCFAKDKASRETLLQQTLAFEALLTETKPSTMQSFALLFKQLQKGILLVVKQFAPQAVQRWQTAWSKTNHTASASVQAVPNKTVARNLYVDSFAAPMVSEHNANSVKATVIDAKEANS